MSRAEKIIISLLFFVAGGLTGRKYHDLFSSRFYRGIRIYFFVLDLRLCAFLPYPNLTDVWVEAKFSGPAVLPYLNPYA